MAGRDKNPPFFGEKGQDRQPDLLPAEVWT
jgi:hypothetical protein